jgi:trans-2-enoyl-CoA reductase
MKGLFIPNCNIYWTDSFTGRKGRAAVAVRKGIYNKHADIIELLSLYISSCWQVI